MDKIKETILIVLESWKDSKKTWSGFATLKYEVKNYDIDNFYVTMEDIRKCIKELEEEKKVLKMAILGQGNGYFINLFDEVKK